MAFQKGKSGNPKGRPLGSLSSRVRLAKLLEPYSEDLIKKTIELALSGDVNALRLCIERLIPKIKREPLGMELPDDLSPANVSKLKHALLCAALNGEISSDEAESLAELIDDQCKSAPSSIPDSLGTDPVAASKTYQRIMMES